MVPKKQKMVYLLKTIAKHFQLHVDIVKKRKMAMCVLQYHPEDQPIHLRDSQPKVSAITVTEFESIQHMTQSEDEQQAKMLNWC